MILEHMIAIQKLLPIREIITQLDNYLIIRVSKKTKSKLQEICIKNKHLMLIQKSTNNLILWET